MKKIVCLLLVLCMAVLALPALALPAFAAVALPYQSKMSANMPTDTFATDGGVDVTFHGGWDAVSYPANNYTAEARLVLNKLINITTAANGNLTAGDAFWGADGERLGTATAVRARSGNAYWGGASSLNTPASHIGGWRYTAEYTGIVTLSFGAIRQIEATNDVYVAAFINGEMVWPTPKGTVYEADAANPFNAWQTIGSTNSVATSFNGNQYLADLFVGQGDSVEFMIAGNGSYNTNKAVVQPIVTYTALVELPKLADTACFTLGEAFGANFYIDPTTLPAGAENVGAYVNGKFVAAVDNCIYVGGISAKNLVDVITVEPACTYGNALLRGEAAESTLADLLMQYVNDGSASDEVKQLAIATLNYATAAQDYFGYNTEKIANQELTLEQQQVKYSGEYESIAVITGEATANVATPHAATLLLNDTVAFKFVYTDAAENFATAYRFALLDGEGNAVKTVAPILCDGQSTTYKAIFDGIMPSNWETAYTVAVIAADDVNAAPTVIGEAVTYSVISYLVRVNGEDSMRLTVIPAMFALYEASAAYTASLA